MRTRTIAILGLALVVTLAASPPSARALDGTVKLGGIIRNQTGDRSAVQETFNVYDGFAVSELRLSGLVNPRHYVALDLRDVNLDSRRGDLVYRMPGLFKLGAGFDQHRQIFSPDAAVTSRRKDWKVGAEYTPLRWLGFSGAFDVQSRDGGRLAYPLGTLSALGTQYDNTLRTGELTAEVHQDGRGAALTYRASEYKDELDAGAKRRGQVASARLYAPDPFVRNLTHLVRVAFGERRLTGGDLDVTMGTFLYTGVLQPVDAFQLKYAFDAQRTDDQSTRLRTDRYQNQIDATWYHPYGQVGAGYAYETNDDDRSLTSYNTWRAGTVFRYRKYVDAKVEYTSRVKKDLEELTLLKDLDASQVRAKLQVRPRDEVAVGVGYAKREREFTDLHVDLKGDVLNAFGRCDLKGWGALSADWSASTDDCQDLTGGFHTRSQAVTGRVDFERIKGVRLASGLTWLNYRRDLDLEKSLVFAEGVFTVRDDYHLEVKYNCYNYDDYILLDRYYTANVLRIDLAYDLHLR